MDEFYTNKLNHLDDLSTYFKKYNAVNGELRAILLFVPFAVIPFVLPPIFCSFSIYDYNELVSFLEENIKYGHLLTLWESTFLLPLGMTISLTDYFYNYRRGLKIEKGVNCEREGLKQILMKMKESLEKQKYIKDEKENIAGLNIEEVENLYYAIGFHYEKYLKYYQKGTLNKKLQKKYSEEKILEIEHYFLEKGFARERKIEK